MTAYIIRRVLVSIPTIFLVVTLVFFAFHVIPGDPAQMYAGEQATRETLEQVRKELGLDKPVPVQYLDYLKRLSRGDLGKSYITRRPVIVEISTRFANTVKLSLAAISLAVATGLTMGVIAALKQERFWDYLFSILALAGISTPVFWLALLLMYVFSLRLHILPTAGNQTWKHYIMPTFCLSVYSIAFITRMTRSSLLELFGEDFVRTARAKGLPERMVLLRHILRNALIPITTVVGLRFGYMLGGAVVTETVFAWPGMGRLLVTAVEQRDIPIVQGVLLVFGTAFVLINLIVDILYSVIDPRIRYR
ncbi:MAG: ABC transporter permease [Anaerolineae bacterium]|nr:ABC transporter permease [Anaerolineae bacterium]